jgi:hypothetical protein
MINLVSQILKSHINVGTVRYVMESCMMGDYHVWFGGQQFYIEIRLTQHSLVIEGICKYFILERAKYIRVLFLEITRILNHVRCRRYAYLVSSNTFNDTLKMHLLKI